MSSMLFSPGQPVRVKVEGAEQAAQVVSFEGNSLTVELQDGTARRVALQDVIG